MGEIRSSDPKQRRRDTQAKPYHPGPAQACETKNEGLAGHGRAFGGALTASSTQQMYQSRHRVRPLQPLERAVGTVVPRLVYDDDLQ